MSTRLKCQWRDCRHRSCREDYRYCRHHLETGLHLRVSQSRIPGVGLGLFAVANRFRDVRTSVVKRAVVFDVGDRIGSFEGEVIDNAEFEHRYKNSDGFAEYVLAIDDSRSHDETTKRTALSYANDAVDVHDPMLRRNYVTQGPTPYETYIVWHRPEWPHVINAVCRYDSERDCASLYALGPISHGEEILFSYGGINGASKTPRGTWLAAADGSGLIQDTFWYGKMRSESMSRGTR